MRTQGLEGGGCCWLKIAMSSLSSSFRGRPSLVSTGFCQDMEANIAFNGIRHRLGVSVLNELNHSFIHSLSLTLRGAPQFFLRKRKRVNDKAAPGLGSNLSPRLVPFLLIIPKNPGKLDECLTPV